MVLIFRVRVVSNIEIVSHHFFVYSIGTVLYIPNSTHTHYGAHSTCRRSPYVHDAHWKSDTSPKMYTTHWKPDTSPKMYTRCTSAARAASCFRCSQLLIALYSQKGHYLLQNKQNSSNNTSSIIIITITCK